ELIGRLRRRLAADPVPALHCLAAVAPGGHTLGIDHLTLHVEAADQEPITGILQVLEYRPRVLAHEDRVRRIVVDAELVTDAMLLADPVEDNPGSRRVGDVVVPVVADGPSGHRTLLDAVNQAALLRTGKQRNEVFLEVTEVLIHVVLLV